MSAEPDAPTLHHELPMRWADLDQLSHVNNVVYLDYAAEALASHVESGELDPPDPRRMTVEFRRPLLLSRTPIEVSTGWDAGQLVQDIRPAGASDVFARVISDAEPGPVRPVDVAGEHRPIRIRRSDLDAQGAVTSTKLFEIGQEARILAVAGLREAGALGEVGTFVVAQVDVTFGEPLTWRAEPYDVSTAVTHVGTKSFALTSWIDGGRAGQVEAVLVGFDLSTQRSRELTPGERSALSPQC